MLDHDFTHVSLLASLIASSSLLSGCGEKASADPKPKPEQETPACVTARADDGSYTLSVPPLCLKGVTLRVEVGGAWRDAGADDALEIKEQDGGLALAMVTKKGPVEAFELRIPAVPADAILQQGYQSWGFSGVIALPATYPTDDGGAPALAAPAKGDPLDEVAGVSYGAAVLGAAGKDVLVVGALSAERATTGIAARRGSTGADVSVVYGAQREPLPADDQGTFRSEVLFLASAKEPNEGLAKLGQALKSALPPGARTPARPPGGWFSWNEHFDKIDAALIQKHVDLVAEKLAPAGLPLVEIDDGWERDWGDWQANDRFPDGIEAMGAAIKAKGLTAGVWMAPFLVSVNSEVGKTIDPALLVKKDDGTPLLHNPQGNPRIYYVLDGTNPASMAIATDAVKKLAAAGFSFFKFDFLYAGALRGARSKEGATGNQALRQGLALLREAAGDGAVINACGTPILPVLGVADSVRIGSDTAYSGVPLSWPFVATAARSMAARAYLSPLVWPDADQAQLRAPLTEDEGRAGALSAALAGPAYSLGDDLTTLDPTRLAFALSPEVLDIAGADAPATADDLFASAAEEVVLNPYIDALENSGKVTSAPPPASFSAVGKSGARYKVVFSWDPPHGVKIEKQP